MIRTFVGQGEHGVEVLVTVYDDAATVAYRTVTQRTWGPPTICDEVTSGENASS